MKATNYYVKPALTHNGPARADVPLPEFRLFKRKPASGPARGCLRGAGLIFVRARDPRAQSM
jgi:hypothetical protein